jgi:tRNA-binding protein
MPDRLVPRKPDVTFDRFDDIDMRVARVLSAPMTEGTRAPSRFLTLDAGPLGQVVSVGQYALVDESDLVGRNVIACVNLGRRNIGKYVSEALVLGVPNPTSPDGQAQALPLFVDDAARPGDRVF